jgi:hypothetical protein
MRHTITLVLMLFPSLGFAAGPAVELSDPGLPLQELRPLDRRVYVLTLEAKWTQTAKAGAHYVNVQLPGGSYAHRVLNDAMLRRGEVRCLIHDHELARHGIAAEVPLTITLSRGDPAAEGGETISNTLTVTWTGKRATVRTPPRSRFGDPVPLDAFLLPVEKPTPETLPQPRPKAEPPK